MCPLLAVTPPDPASFEGLAWLAKAAAALLVMIVPFLAGLWYRKELKSTHPHGEDPHAPAPDFVTRDLLTAAEARWAEQLRAVESRTLAAHSAITTRLDAIARNVGDIERALGRTEGTLNGLEKQLTNLPDLITAALAK